MDSSNAFVPRDKFGVVFIIFLIQGVGTLLPWNMFITANDYYVDYKFNPPNATEASESFRSNYLAYVGIASKFPNLALQATNFVIKGGSESIGRRIFISLAIQIVVFIFTMIMAFLNTFGWITLFFILTILSLILINMANGIYQSCLFACAANLPRSYTNAIVTGMNISGTFAAIVLILSLIISPDQRMAAICYFAMAVLFLIVCFLCQFALVQNKFFQYFQDTTHADRKRFLKDGEKGDGPEEEREEERSTKSFVRIFPRIWLAAFNNFMVMFVSLSVFPSVIANTKSLNHFVPDKFFSPIFCFLSFNLFAVIGNLLPNHIPMTNKQGKLFILILSRILFIPFFLLCNYNPTNRKWPVIFSNDIYPVIGCIFLALTSGFLSSSVQMNMPKLVDLKDAPIAGMMASFSCMLGILAGVSIAPILSHIVNL